MMRGGVLPAKLSLRGRLAMLVQVSQGVIVPLHLDPTDNRYEV